MRIDRTRERLEISNASFAMHTSWITAAIGVLALALGVVAVPIAGANCPGDCIGYPYLDTLDRFPHDYLWIYVAIALVLAYLVFMVSLRVVLVERDDVIGQIAVALTIASTVVLATTYFAQVSVVPSSLAAGETEGLTLVTMYNPHGLFIALEEIGYLLMSVSFLLVSIAIIGDGRMMRSVRWVFACGFIIPVLALILYSAAYGLDRQDRLEVVALSTDWLVLIINGILVSLIIRNRLRTSNRPTQLIG